MSHRRIVFPLDYPTLAAARQGAQQLAGAVGVFKVGLELFTKEGPAALAIGREYDVDVFADLKLHDIPETVERAVAAVAQSRVRYVTVHATGGAAMLARAVARAAKESGGSLMVLAVTVLTSLDDGDLTSLGIEARTEQQVLRLARLAWSAGVRGFVCSPGEVALLRGAFGSEATFVTPGVRPAGTSADDQKRVATPGEAIARGADLIVVGRPIRDAHDPRAAAEAIAQEVARALEARPETPAFSRGARA